MHRQQMLLVRRQAAPSWIPPESSIPQHLGSCAEGQRQQETLRGAVAWDARLVPGRSSHMWEHGRSPVQPRGAAYMQFMHEMLCL